MVKYEHSAGGVIYRKTHKGIAILLLKDKNGNWSFPKGIIEDGEDPIKTAEREIAEEVGLGNLTFVNSLDSIGYFYRFQGALIRKKVDYFLFEYKGSDVPQPLAKEGISEVAWFDPKKALAILGYAKTNKPILEEALKLIKGYSV